MRKVLCCGEDCVPEQALNRTVTTIRVEKMGKSRLVILNSRLNWSGVITIILMASLDIRTDTRCAERQPNFADGGLQCVFHSGGALDLLPDGIDQ